MQIPADDGHLVSVEVSGVGPTVLIVPPGGADASTWRSTATSLSTWFRVAVVQRRIYEPEAFISLPHTMDREMRDVITVARHMGPAVVGVGHSSGAVALLVAAEACPSVFRQLILYEPPVPMVTPVGGDSSTMARDALKRGDASEALRIHLEQIVQLPASVVAHIMNDRRLSGGMLSYLPAQLADTESIDALVIGRQRFSAMTIPTVLLEGALSPSHLRVRSELLFRRLPAVSRRVMQGESHAANLSSPAELAALIRDVVSTSSTVYGHEHPVGDREPADVRSPPSCGGS
ncbi:alpha/beta fold hydrolase [Williamsia sterculiae]|uniref:alpha/beta fold hydrolase n=1 Tax=Williamsia sterculiae TaxID=1344003 RepID=UPI00135636D9|nr:alpha/beta hydrolase [Williamsia sterculiae]